MSGPLAALVSSVQEATEQVRSMAGSVADSATDAAVTMIDLAGLVHAVNQLARAANGIEVATLAGYARRDEISDPDDPFTQPTGTIRARGHVHTGTASEIANLLGVSDGSAFTRASRAAELASRLPRTLAVVTGGGIELWQALKVLDEIRLLSDDEARAVDEWLAPRLGTIEPTRIGSVVRYAIGRVNPDALRTRSRKTMADRTLEVTAAHEPGLSHIYALVPAEKAAAIWEAAGELAAQYRALDPELTADQARADAFVDLILSDVQVSATVTLGMPVITSSTSAVGDAHDRVDDPSAGKAPDELTEEDLDRRFGPEPPPRHDPIAPDPDHDGPTDTEPSPTGIPPTPRHDPIAPDPDYAGRTDTEPTPRHDPIAPDPDYAGPTDTAPDRIPDWMLEPERGLNLSCQVGGAGPMAGAFTTGVTLPKVGHIPADVIAALLGHLDLTIATALIDATTGTVQSTVTGAYRPTAAMRHFVASRDQTCRMYGCTRPAVESDLDHALPHHRGGATSPTNLAALCRAHHLAKQSRHWTYHLDPDTGEATWVCRRTGTVRQTQPATALAAYDAHQRARARQQAQELPEPARAEPRAVGRHRAGYGLMPSGEPPPF